MTLLKNKEMINQVKRYNGFAIIVHWLMAVGFFLMLGSGIFMVYFEIDKSLQFNIYQWHKSGGVLLLFSFLLRITIRLASTAPELPETLSRSERLAAKIGHIALYALMLLVPLSGWLMVSASVIGLPTIVFGLFEWPHIYAIEADETLENLAKTLHLILTITFGLLIAGHIAAVIKHAIIDKENLLVRLWWMKEK